MRSSLAARSSSSRAGSSPFPWWSPRRTQLLAPAFRAAPAQPQRPREGDFVLRASLPLGREARRAAHPLPHAGLARARSRRRDQQRGADPSRHGRLRPAVPGHASFASVLYGPGQPLDTTRTFVILSDGIGHGASSKPERRPCAWVFLATIRRHGGSGVQARYRVPGVQKLRLVMGTSMGGMHTWVWARRTPTRCARSCRWRACRWRSRAGTRLWRAMFVDAIRGDPMWLNGEYMTEPAAGLRTAADLLLIAGSAPALQQREMSSRGHGRALSRPGAAHAHGAARCERPALSDRRFAGLRPLTKLEQITAPLVW